MSQVPGGGWRSSGQEMSDGSGEVWARHSTADAVFPPNRWLFSKGRRLKRAELTAHSLLTLHPVARPTMRTNHRLQDHTAGVARRAMPPELIAALRRARAAEQRAFPRRQLRLAVRETAELARRAHDGGWLYAELAPALGISESTLRQRVSRIAPGEREQRPRDEPEWLTVSEASRFAGVSAGLLNQWYRAGLLPRTQRRGKIRLLYARSDLQRILDAPRYGRRGVSWLAVRAIIRREGG